MSKMALQIAIWHKSSILEIRKGQLRSKRGPRLSINVCLLYGSLGSWSPDVGLTVLSLRLLLSLSLRIR